ncbi:MAG: helix-turn-helix domain-containing protein, partial [Acidobacteriota bacterium]|nr:helix-turn-helix domain-containing protein [Acidobacteriota bacterium]
MDTRQPKAQPFPENPVGPPISINFRCPETASSWICARFSACALVCELRVRLHMADVAARLRTARVQAGLTIEDLSARTKIKPAALAAIECGDFDRLPGEFFTRAFLG